MKNISLVAFLFISLLAMIALSVPCQAETIYACVHKSQGLTRIVASAKECNINTETVVSWNTVGPQGPAGSIGPAGPVGGRNFTSSLISSAEIQACGAGELEGCQTKDSIGIRVSEEPITIDALDLRQLDPDYQGILEITRIEITKEFEVPCNDTDVTVTGPTHRNCGGENDYHMKIQVTKGTAGTPFYVNISPRIPIYNTQADEHCSLVPADCPVPIKAKLNNDSLLTLEIDAAKLSVVTTESSGVINSAKIEYDQKKGADMLKVVIWNTGNFKASYIVSADDCAGIVPLTAQVETLNVGEVRTTLWTLQAKDPANQDGGHVKNPISCKVSLISAAGRVYDSVPVIRPYPY